MSVLKSVLFFLSVFSFVELSFASSAGAEAEDSGKARITKVKVEGASSSRCKADLNCEGTDVPFYVFMNVTKKRGEADSVKKTPQDLYISFDKQRKRTLWLGEHRLSLFSVLGELDGRLFASFLYEKLLGKIHSDGFESIEPGNNYTLNISFGSLDRVDDGTALPASFSLEKQ